MNACQDPAFLSLILFFKIILDIIAISVPIILIIVLSIKLAKLVIEPDKDKSELKIIVAKIINAICIFFVPMFVNISFSLIGMVGIEQTECWINANSNTIAKYRAIEEAKEQVKIAKRNEENAKIQEENLKKNALREEKAREESIRQDAIVNPDGSVDIANSNIGSGFGGSGNCSGIYAGTKYNLTDSQITQLSRMIYGEYSSDINGMKAVASHMANLYELRRYYNLTGNKTLFQYITTCGWYATAKLINVSKYDNSNAKQAVIDVLVNGNRTLPLYIDEFDWFPNDILGANSIYNYKNYTSGITKLKNVYGASGTYYCVTVGNGAKDGNIFFYTSRAEKYKQAKGY